MSEFERRRQSFVKSIGNAVALFSSAPERARSNDTTYEYRQNTDFYYLTGFEEPESILVLAPAHPEFKSALFVRPHHKDQEVWNGRRTGVDEAKRLSGVDVAYPIGEFRQRLGSFLETADRLYYSFESERWLNDEIIERLKHFRRAIERTDGGPLGVIDPGPILHEMRVHKTPFDIARMRRAVEVSAAGHAAAMRHARPGMHEYEIEAIVEYVFCKSGAQSPAFPTIVASGANLATIHYCTNRDLVPQGSLVLVDAGAEVDYYCGDITRTWPISGKFAPEQREVYEIVLAAQSAALALCKPGAKYNTDVNDAAARVLVEGLVKLGVLGGSADEHLEKETHKRFTLHRIGHWLGMDTHDVGPYRAGGDWRPLEPGMVVTIEPGLYIPDEPDVPQRWRGISVRIEDNVLITKDGHEVLSSDAPKSVQAVEKLIAEGRASAQALIA